MNVNNSENLRGTQIFENNQNEIYAEWNTKQVFINSIYNLDRKEGLSSEEEFLTLRDSLNELKSWFEDVKNKIGISKLREISSFIRQTENNLAKYITEKGEPSPLYTDLYKEGLLDDGYKREVLPVMQRFANEALKHMVNNGGELENFNFTGLPLGVEVQNVELIEDYSNSINDTYTYNNSQGEVHRNVDFGQVKITFTYNDKPYTIQGGFSDLSILEARSDK